MNAREAVIRRLYEAGQPLPLHALKVPGVSESAAGARLRELTREGITVRVQVPGKKFLAWTLAKVDSDLPFEAA